MKNIYLDYAATTPMDSRVKAAMEPYFSDEFGNPGALYKIGQEASAAVFKARRKIAESIGADYKEIIFTGSATEANNLALRGVVKEFRIQNLKFRGEKFTAKKFLIASQNSTGASLWMNGVYNTCRRSRHLSIRISPDAPGVSPGRDSPPKSYILNPSPRIIVSAVEHESVLATCRDLAAEGAEIIYIPASREGIVDLEKLKAALNERTILVSVMYANNEVGTIQSISKIAKIISDFRNGQVQSSMPTGRQAKFKVQSFYPLFHTDAVQAFQYLNCNVNELGVDMMTLSAHKIYGPKGIGALYVRRIAKRESPRRKAGFQRGEQSVIKERLALGDLRLASIVTGGGQEWGLRSGTENVASIAGFAKAVELVSNSRELENKRISKLRDYLWAKIRKIDPKIKLNGSAGQRLPNNLNIYFPKQKSGELLIKLDLLGVSVSPGAACSARTTQPSYVLEAMGFSRDRCAGSLRFSLGRPTKLGDIEEAIKRVKIIAKREDAVGNILLS